MNVIMVMMHTTTSARRGSAGSSPVGGIGAVLPYVLIGVGALLAGVSLWTQFSGDVLLSQRIVPEGDGMATVYTARTIEVDAGEYGLTLDLDDVHVLLSVAGGVGYSVTSPEHQGWTKRGLLKTRKHRNSSREDGFVSTVISIPDGGPTTLVIALAGDFNRDLDLTLRTVQADFRIPMYLGIALAAIGIAMHRPLRDRLLALSQRS